MRHNVVVVYYKEDIMEDENPKNPRIFLSNHKERGPKKYTYTLDDLAELYGVSRRTLGRWIRRGDLNPYNIRSIIDKYVKTVK